MSLTSRVLSISLGGLMWSAACANELPETADNGKGAAGSVASPVVGRAAAGSPSAPAAPTSTPTTGTAAAPASTSSAAQPSRSAAASAAPSSGAAGAASPAKPAATSGSAGSAGSVPPAPAAGSAAPPAAGGGAAGAEALPDLTEILPPLSTPETRIPSPDNPAECPATAPENPVGDCLGLPIYLECNYGTYFCVCDWYHWLCAG